MSTIVAIVIVLVLSLIAFVLSRTLNVVEGTGPKRGEKNTDYNRGALFASLGLLALAVGITVFNSVYTQDPGQAKVLRSWTGEVVGQSTSEGLKFKAPWVDVIDYDIRNQQVIFALQSSTRDGNGMPNGPQITVQDREGVTANIDITVRYSIKPESVTEIYKRYNTQENFVSKFIENDIRAAVRTVPAKYGTLELLNSRAQAEIDIVAYLEDRWTAQGVSVETVSLQEIRYSDDVKSRFDAAQAARIEIEKAQAELEATQISAKQKIVQAEAEAEANRILAASLTDRILQQRYLDTLALLAKAGNLVITDGKSNSFINVR